MEILLDTGILLRFVIPSDPLHNDVLKAVRLLRVRGFDLISLTQNMAECWTVCTRPRTVRGGYGLDIEKTARKMELIERFIEIRPDTVDIFHEWKTLIITHSVSGVKTHDARIVAAMNVYGVTELLTLNKKDFNRFPGIKALEPNDIV